MAHGFMRHLNSRQRTLPSHPSAVWCGCLQVTSSQKAVALAQRLVAKAEAKVAEARLESG